VTVLETHIVNLKEERIRFVDFAVGLFSGFETRNAVKKGIKNHRFLINNEPARTGTWIKSGDRIDLLVSRNRPKAYLMEIEVVYEDDHLAVVNKPAGLIVSGNQFKTLENALVDQLQIRDTADALDWALPIHRLDAPTSGLVIFAKTHSSRRILGEMLERKEIRKEYHAIVHGKIEAVEIKSDVGGKMAFSRVKLVRSVFSLKNDQLSLVLLQPVTGRTHQLRIHCAAQGSPIVGDKLYGNADGTFRNKGLMLAATSLSFHHPITGIKVDVQISIPPKFESLLKREENRAKKYGRY